jgi:hypothetical protein
MEKRKRLSQSRAALSSLRGLSRKRPSLRLVNACRIPEFGFLIQYFRTAVIPSAPITNLAR